MFKKIICILSVVCLALSLAACGGSATVDMDGSGEVSSNGGFVVETKDYVYFINGVESYSTSYKTGEVVKGALMRVKKSDLGDLKEDKSETVVSKLIVSGDYGAGLYIYGEYLYYAVPSTEKDGSGSVKNSKLNFFRTKLDGSNTSSKITDKDFGNSAEYRYVADANGKVYLVVYETSIYVYDAESRKQVYSYEKTIDEVLFDDDGAAALFFTVKPINENLYDPESESAQQENYQEVHSLTFGDGVTDTTVISGAGKYAVGGSGEGVGLTGATVDLIKHKGGTLYLSYTLLDTTVSSTVYLAIDDGKLKEDDHKGYWTKEENATKMVKYNLNASKIFADGSYIKDKNTVLYIDADYGLMKYDYGKVDETSTTTLGVSLLYESDNIKSATISSVKGDYLYYYNESNFYRVNLAALLNGEEAEEHRINKISINTSWYKPEVVSVGGTDYFIAVYTGDVYASYCYIVNINQVETLYDSTADEEKDDFYTFTETYEAVEKVVTETLLGKMSDDDKTEYEDYLEDLDHEESK